MSERSRSSPPGAAAFASLAAEAFPQTGGQFLAGVATGVGFLGIGVIWRLQMGPARGLTTAAATWTVAATGRARRRGLLPDGHPRHRDHPADPRARVHAVDRRPPPSDGPGSARIERAARSRARVRTVVEHGGRELARERVLLTRVEASHQGERTDGGLRAVTEARLRPRGMARALRALAARRPTRTSRARRSREGPSSTSISRSRNGRHVSRSRGVGLFAGGAQRFTGRDERADQAQAVVARRPTSAGSRRRNDGATRTGSRPSDRR